MQICDIKSTTDLTKVKHYKRGDHVQQGSDDMIGQTIRELVYVDDPVAGAAVVFFMADGSTGSVSVDRKTE